MASNNVNPVPPAHPTRGQDIEREAIQGAIIAGFQSMRRDIAKWILDYIPDAHLLNTGKIAKLLPLVAIAFKMSTKPGWKLDTLDDIVQDLTQALKEEAEQRIAAGANPTAAAPPAQAPTLTAPPDEATKQYARFIFAATTLGQQDFDDLTAWHDNLSDDDKRRLYTLVGNASDTQLALLVSKKIPVLRALIAQVQLPAASPPSPVTTQPPTPAPPTYMQFRMEVAADTMLTTRVNTFLTAKNIVPPKFWKAVEQHYAKLVKDKTGFALLMNLTDDEIVSHLGLDFDADQWSKDFLKNALNWAKK